jgi:hypothetical protein
VWEQTTAGAGGGAGGSADRSKEGAGGKGKGRGRDASAAAAASGGGGGKSSLPPVEDMHPSWAARVKQQEVVKVNQTWLHVAPAICSFPLSLLLTPPSPSPPSFPPPLPQAKVQASAAARVHIKFDD